ncbi:hypothetical protein MKX03_037458 [Papaver bracteatum]|nr:hypothetical protein MKX03_037458 [Papaver bracteatum]
MMSGNRCQSSNGEHEPVEGRRRQIDSHGESNHEDHTTDSYGSTFRLPGNRKKIIFDKYGRPCDVGSEQFVTEIGKIVRAHCHPAIDSWTVVLERIKDDIWNNVTVKYEVAEIYKPNILTKANVSWRNWKHQLRLVMDKYDIVAEMKRNMPERLIAKREDWESFFDFCNTDEDKKLRAAGKKAREAVELLQSCGRKGIARTIYDLDKESPTSEINRCVVFATTHVTKTINDPAKIKELVDANPEGQNDIYNDAIAKVPDESKLPAASNCFIKNFIGRTIALGTFNNAAAPMEHAYSISVEEIFDRDAELYDEDGTLGDILFGKVINWPKGSVQPYR